MFNLSGSHRLKMNGRAIQIPLPKIEDGLIMNYFKFVRVDSSLVLYKCNSCSELVTFCSGQKNLQEHLELHPTPWDHYLTDVGNAILPFVPAQTGIDVLKLTTLLVVENTKEEFILKFPLSRIQRDFSDMGVTEALSGFDGRLQREYNKSPVGPYMGPYDQNESLGLNVQLPTSTLDYDQYTDFEHSDDFPCCVFSIKDSYKRIDPLQKIDSLRIDKDLNESYDFDEEHVLYTCEKKECKIPCPCSTCCTRENQCKEHRIKHEEQFDDKNDVILVRGSDKFCTDSSFMKRSYYVKYPGIPIKCLKCKKDFCDHVCYHIDYHDKCKFCRKNSFKTHAETGHELHKAMKKHVDFLKTVCPYCDNKFCEVSSRNKHIKLAHGSSPFQCDHCPSKFQSKQAKEYHENVQHFDVHEDETCALCGKTFSGKVCLKNHQKYVHSGDKDHECVICDVKFKQKKDMRTHVLNVHGFNMSKSMYGNPEEQERYECDMCDSSYKQKKDLNHHKRQKHEQHNIEFPCAQCSSIFKAKKTLTAHIKMKHTDGTSEFPCPACGQIFHQKNNMKRHLREMHKN